MVIQTQRALWSYLQLLRPPNLVTAAADILAGFAVAGLTNLRALPWLLVASIGLYGGGVVLNDVFDRNLDARERPERPLPSGRVTLRSAALLGVNLLIIGIAAASMSSGLSAMLALLIAVCVVFYNAFGKHIRIVAPLNMGACRGLNLLLGISAVPATVGESWYLALIPVAYIGAITLVSAGEVHGGNRGTMLFALALVGVIIFALAALSLTFPYSLLPFKFFALLPFLVYFAWRVLPAFWGAYLEPQPLRIRHAVKAGVLSLIALDAALAVVYASPLYGLLILSLMPVASRIARLFAVT